MTQGEQWEATCRICLESSPVLCSDDAVVLSEDRLISPCACSDSERASRTVFEALIPYHLQKYMATGNARNPIPQHNSGNANMSALFVGILVPLLFSFVCRNMKRRKERGVPMKAGGDPGFTIRNSRKVSTVICDYMQMKKIIDTREHLDFVKHIVYMEDKGIIPEPFLLSATSKWTVSSFSEVEVQGRKNHAESNLPVPADIAVIMYTSGSTGLPKGVMMTHGNVVATVAAVTTILPRLCNEDIYLAYLPLAHIFELAAEATMIAAGCAIGYGSPLTLTDTSNKIEKGTQGDASMLGPTLMTAVPAILDLFRDGVRKKVEAKGEISKKLFDISYRRRLAAIEGSWHGAWGLEKLLWDELVFKKIRAILGGHVRGLLSGGAPLSGDTQRFINICLGAPIMQGYGLTETCAGATFSEWDDSTVGRVGPPLPSCYVKLIDWEEGGYFTTDVPMPRGEIVVGGANVTLGYFKRKDKTNEVYMVDEKGTRWFYTGEKLQNGKYVPLGKVEAALIVSHYVDNIMLHADPFHNYCVALVVPSRQTLQIWAQKEGFIYDDFEDLCLQKEAIQEVYTSLLKLSASQYCLHSLMHILNVMYGVL